MTEVATPHKKKPSTTDKLLSSGLAFFGTILFFAVLGLLTGSLGVGLIDVIVIGGIIAVLLIWIWRPRKNSTT